MQYVKYLTHILIFVLGFLTKDLFTFHQKNDLNKRDIGNLDISVMKTISDKPGVKVWLFSNPACVNCQEMKFMMRKFSERDVEYDSFFFPEMNIDIWLSALISLFPKGDNSGSGVENNRRYEFYEFLVRNKQQWEDLENIYDMKGMICDNFLDEAAFLDLINDIDKFDNVKAQYKYLQQLFGIKGLPTAVVGLVLTGDVPLDRMMSLIEHMNKFYKGLVKEGRVL